MALLKFTESFLPSSTPKTWERQNLGSVITRSQYGLNEPAVEGGTVPIVGMKEIVGGNVSTANLPTISGDLDTYADYQLHQDDILINRTNSYDLVGKAAIFNGGADCVYASYLVRFEPDKKRVYPQYLNFWLGHSIAQRAMKRIATRAIGQANLNPTELKKLLPLLLPPYPEQKRISSVLLVATRQIEVMDGLIQNTISMKRALMQRLLTGKERIGGFVKPWKTHTLDELFGRVVERNKGQSNNVLTISGEHGLVSQAEFFYKRIASDDVSNYIYIRRGDFAYNKSYSNGFPMGVIAPLSRYDDGIVSSLYICFRLKKYNEQDADFFRLLFEAGIVNHSLIAIAQEGARNHGLLNISVKDFLRLDIAIPEIEERRAITQVLCAVEAELKNMRAQRDYIQQSLTGLMQQLLTGKRRVRAQDDSEPIAVNGRRR